MDCSIWEHASFKLVACCAFPHAKSTNLSTNGPLLVVPQKAAAISGRLRISYFGSNLNFGMCRLATPTVSWLSAQITTPSEHLNPAIIVTAFLSGSRSGKGLTAGFGVIYTPPKFFCEVNNLVLKSYLEYYQRSRTHLGLDKDTPEARVVQPSEMGEIVELPQVGGLHHRYERRAASPLQPVQPAFCSNPTLTLVRRFLFHRQPSYSVVQTVPQ